MTWTIDSCLPFSISIFFYRLFKEIATHSSTLAWKNSMDGGAWWATVHRGTESDTTERLHFLSPVGREKVEEAFKRRGLRGTNYYI